MRTLAHSRQRPAGLTARPPWRPAIAFQKAIREAAPLVAFEIPTSFSPQPWSFRDPGRSPLWRFFAHLLIRLLILTPLPPQLQAAAVLFPVSVLWPLFVRETPPSAPKEKAADPTSVAQDPLGNVTTFTRSQFVDEATGKTAIGPGGGTVTAADGSGVELRIPEGALDKGVTFTISGVTAVSPNVETRPGGNV